MIKFFRHIRKSLLEQNKMGKYFKYAIGEIALVMIGILLALQVNNWNESRKELQLEKRYLSELIFDLQTDSLAIAEMLKQSNIQAKQKRKLVGFFNQKKIYPRDSLSEFFNIQWQITYSFNPITTTLDEMKSTGNIGVITNLTLRRKILETYNNYKVYINSDEHIYKKQQDEAWKLFFSKVPNLYTGNDLQNNNADVKKALSNFEIRNRLFGNYVQGINDAIKELSQWNSELLKALKEEVVN